jgi:hypothetical protein
MECEKEIKVASCRWADLQKERKKRTTKKNSPSKFGFEAREHAGFENFAGEKVGGLADGLCMLFQIESAHLECPQPTKRSAQVLSQM